MGNGITDPRGKKWPWVVFLALRDSAESQRAECKRAERHSAKSQDVDASRCRMYHRAKLQRDEMHRGRRVTVPNITT
jgi:hypothetical protein